MCSSGAFFSLMKLCLLPKDGTVVTSKSPSFYISALLNHHFTLAVPL
jgi:hypothetical protein